MYIEPGTNIRLLKNVPLDTTYNHTIYFDSASAQSAYFAGLAKYNLANYTYQRVQRGVARVGISADLLYDCNYMMFQNANYGSKWFYAFITSVEYVNNACSEIRFELDVMQTWFFDYSLGQCFVEREHTSTDVIGEHIEPEPVELGEYVYNGYIEVTGLSNMCVIIGIVDVEEGSSGNMYDGIYGGATLFVYRLQTVSDVNAINAKLNEYTQKPDAVVCMYMCPTAIVGYIPDNHQLNFGAAGTSSTVTVEGVSSGDALNGYIPRNKKLYTYPYNFLHVDNASGGELTLRYELFNGAPRLGIDGTITQPVSVTLRPMSYKGGGNKTLNSEVISLNNFPICSWNNDAFQVWSSQNAIPMAFSGLSKVAGSVASLNPITMGGNLVDIASNAVMQYYQASIASDIGKGTLSNGGVNTAVGKQQFYYGRCSVTAQYARIIDDFFSVYGYAVKRVKTPNRKVRPHWTYVKTAGCVAKGSVPADDMRRICGIYDKGITFWVSGAEVGNYSLDNSV